MLKYPSFASIKTTAPVEQSSDLCRLGTVCRRPFWSHSYGAKVTFRRVAERRLISQYYLKYITFSCTLAARSSHPRWRCQPVVAIEFPPCRFVLSLGRAPPTKKLRPPQTWASTPRRRSTQLPRWRPAALCALARAWSVSTRISCGRRRTIQRDVCELWTRSARSGGRQRPPLVHQSPNRHMVSKRCPVALQI